MHVDLTLVYNTITIDKELRYLLLLFLKKNIHADVKSLNSFLFLLYD